MPPMTDLIIDCDPGIDDALALLVAAGASDALRLRAVTCVAGNRPVKTTADNACRLLDAAGRADVPVFAGAFKPLAYAQARCNLVHGEDGLGGVELARGREPETESAVHYLVRTLTSAPPRTITLVAIGPLTNLALAELQAPGVLARAASVLVMGGALMCPGNITAHAEFNFYADPDAARVVLNSGAQIELFGLDVTTQAKMSPAWIDSLRGLGSRCGQLSYSMLQAYAQQDPLLHDVCPIAYLLKPELFRGSLWSIDVNCERGSMAGRSRGEPLTPSSDVLLRSSHRALVRAYFHVDRAGLLLVVRDRLARLQ